MRRRKALGQRWVARRRSSSQLTSCLCARTSALAPQPLVASLSLCRCGLPNTLDPTNVPPPPYYASAANTNLDALQPRVVQILRPVLTGLLYALFGPNTPTLSLVGPNSGMKQSYDARIVLRGSYDLGTGSWTDQYGLQGHEIEAYVEGGDGIIEVVQGFKFRIDNRLGKDSPENPPVVEFIATETLRDGHVVFFARELDDEARKYFNKQIYDDEWR